MIKGIIYLIVLFLSPWTSFIRISKRRKKSIKKKYIKLFNKKKIDLLKKKSVAFAKCERICILGSIFGQIITFYKRDSNRRPRTNWL